MKVNIPFSGPDPSPCSSLKKFHYIRDRMKIKGDKIIYLSWNNVNMTEILLCPQRKLSACDKDIHRRMQQ